MPRRLTVSVWLYPVYSYGFRGKRRERGGCTVLNVPCKYCGTQPHKNQNSCNPTRSSNLSTTRCVAAPDSLKSEKNCTAAGITRPCHVHAWTHLCEVSRKMSDVSVPRCDAISAQPVCGRIPGQQCGRISKYEGHALTHETLGRLRRRGALSGAVGRNRPFRHSYTN